MITTQYLESVFLPYSKFHLKRKDGTMGKIKAPAYAAYSYLNLRYSLYKLLHVTSWHQLTGQWNFIQTRFSHLHSFKNSISFTQMIKLAHLRSVFQQYKKHSENQLKCFLENETTNTAFNFTSREKKTIWKDKKLWETHILCHKIYFHSPNSPKHT